MKIHYHIHILNSRRDIYGNCYWALQVTDNETGETCQGTVDCEGNHRIYERSGTYRETQEELPKRAFNRLTKSWPYFGCNGEDIWKRIKEELAS